MLHVAAGGYPGMIWDIPIGSADILIIVWLEKVGYIFTIVQKPVLSRIFAESAAVYPFIWIVRIFLNNNAVYNHISSPLITICAIDLAHRLHYQYQNLSSDSNVFWMFYKS